MKTIKIILITIFACIYSINTFAQSCHGGGSSEHTTGGNSKHANHTTKPTTGTQLKQLLVYGNCTDCKTRIENAAKSAGANSAFWDIKTKALSITYDASSTSLVEISKQIAFVGHDTENDKSDDKAYNKLPKCCQYPRKK